MIAGIILLAISCSCSGNKQKSIELNSEADLSGLTLSTAVGNYYEHKFSKRSDVKVFAPKPMHFRPYVRVWQMYLWPMTLRFRSVPSKAWD